MTNSVNKNLIIDTTNNYCILALSDDNATIIDQIVIKTHNNLTELVTNLLHDLLSRNQCDYQNLQKIYVVIGPGSFTGVKVGVSIVKTICMVYPSIQVYWMDSVSLICNFDGLGILDAKSQLSYIIGYKDQHITTPLQYIENNELPFFISQYTNVVSFDQISIEQYCDNLFQNLNKFHYLEDFNLLLPAYLKPALYNVKNPTKKDK